MNTRRPETSVGLYDISALLRVPIESCNTMRMTVAATTAAKPQSAASAVQQYTSADRYQEIWVCGGTIIKRGDTYGVLAQDTLAGTTGTFITECKNLLFQIVAADAASITEGVDIYIVDSTMRVSHDSSSGTRNWIGKAIGACETNPAGLPAGIYVPVNFEQGAAI
jgi:predicted RecA/RadA family phage recombinase